jgi:uncharacterized protein (DUF362 family)
MPYVKGWRLWTILEMPLDTSTTDSCSHEITAALLGEKFYMNRRDFCRHLAAVGGAALLSSCRIMPDPESNLSVTKLPDPTATSSPSPFPTATNAATATHTAVLTASPDPTASPQSTPTISPTPDLGLSQVALVRTTDRAQGVRSAIELLGINPVRGNKVLFKPNFNSIGPSPASTHLDTMRSTMIALEEMGARSITVGERSGMGITRQVLQFMGVFSLAEELGFSTVVFDELEEKDWIIRRSGDFHWADGFAVPKLLLDSESVVQTCCLKTHRYGGHFTLSLKNNVGFVAKKTHSNGYNYMTELHDSAYQRHLIAEINTVIKPALIILDGVEAFLSGGPALGKKADTGVILAGTDPVAIDAVGVAILRMFGTTPEVSKGKIFEQEQIRRAVELELGASGPEQIQLLTGDMESLAFATKVEEWLFSA